MSKPTTLDPPDLRNFPGYARPFLKAFQALVIGNAKRTIRKEHETNLAALESVLKTLSENRKKMESVKMGRGIQVVNVARFAFIIQYDVTTLAHDMLLTKNVWRRKLYGRLLALTLIESVEDLAKMLGWPFRRTVAAVYNDPVIDTRIQSITRDMDKFIQRHNKLLREIRLTVSAHRDQDATEQLRVIENLDCAALMEVATEFVDQNNAVLALLYDLMVTAHSNSLYLKMW